MADKEPTFEEDYKMACQIADKVAGLLDGIPAFQILWGLSTTISSVICQTAADIDHEDFTYLRKKFIELLDNQLKNDWSKVKRQMHNEVPNSMFLPKTRM